MSAEAERHKWRNSISRARAIKVARAVAERDPTDPYKYGRVLTRLMNGSDCPEDYAPGRVG